MSWWMMKKSFAEAGFHLPGRFCQTPGVDKPTVFIDNRTCFLPSIHEKDVDMRFLFLHGLAGDPDDWEHIMAELPGDRVLAPRIPYFDSPYNCLDELAGHVLDSLPPDWPCRETVVVGNSLGGTLALILGEQAQRLVLVASHLPASRYTPTRGTGRGSCFFHRELERIVHNVHVLDADKIAGYRKKWRELIMSRARVRRLRAIKKIAATFPVRRYWELLQHKITFVCGSHDRISPVNEFQELHGTLPGSRLHILPDCGHAVPLEKPAALLAMIRQP
jgi:pimeloyl-ACP methyl ester carboxylesterase